MKDHAPGLERAFTRNPEERQVRVRAVEGTVPGYLRGTYYLNGPARFERNGRRYGHWLDGDGMICALRFDAAGTELACRYVRGDKWRAEEEAGKPLFRAFGTAFEGDRLKRGGTGLESPLNVSVLPYRGTLLAFGEQGLPWELDPETLETRGEYRFGGAVGPLAPFAAHPKVDPVTGEVFHFGVSFAVGAPQLHLYRFGEDGGLVWRRRVPLPWPCSVHDFALGREHAVFYLSPYLLDMPSLADQGRTVLDALRWEPAMGSRLLVVSRETGKAVASVPIGERYSLHAINTFENGDGRLIVDVLELDRPVYDQYRLPFLFESVAPGRPVRLEIDLEEGRLVNRRELPYELAPDFAAIDPRCAGQAYRDFWMLGISATGKPGRKFFDQLARGDWGTGEVEFWQAPRGVYLAGEPAFAPDPEDADAGAVLVPLFDSSRGETTFAVFEARQIASGPKAVLRPGCTLPLAFHGLFEPS